MQSSKSSPESGVWVVNGFPTYFCTKNDTDILRSKNNISKVQLFYKYLSSCTYNWEYIEEYKILINLINIKLEIKRITIN